MKHVRSISEIGTEGVVRILRTARHMEAVNSRPVPKVPALVGRTVVSLFFEDSTRTRISFETAARRLSADTVNFSVSTSSLNKGESLRDTIETVSAMGAAVFVVRHRTSGVPWQISEWTDASIVNAGDGWHQHPTQALLDCYTVMARRGLDPSPECLAGLRIAIVGDSRHSRVARSCLEAFSGLGAEVVLVGPATLLPPDTTSWTVSTSTSLDDVLPEVDVVYMLRMQRERMNEALVPDLAEYSRRFGLNETRWSRTRPDTLLMHPGPMNRGVEMMFDPSSTTQSAIIDQVTHGISVRMAVLFELLASGDEVPS
ncbi:MAG: aspartate carbamoyltransferase catalytic subunit [Actinomycetota bacterium]|nr:aspartate carbamoyltransferase catalytic subunit [Actinomycetota bacterium]MDA3011397.1 aspartate carbamoyltransferase catalytic subunit [Actinomycetota bacterium]MDA3024261.1 aspartate carbamoyltransferase catalytic subunit [Actinomycetota bacterium]